MPSKNEHVIELSVEETNKLRAQLGLAPLRVSEHVVAGDLDKKDDAGVLEMSVEETNALRETLGLAPLRASSKEVVHQPAENEYEKNAAAERVERAKLQRQVQEGLSLFSEDTLGAAESSAKSWAEEMRKQKKKDSSTKKTKATTTKEETPASYDEEHLKGINVGHSHFELQDGSTTVLTLADSHLLATQDDTSKKILGLNEDALQLENVNLAEARKQETGLRDKRKMELGMGHAGGYAGYDDDEFEELGGSQVPSRLARSAAAESNKKPVRGFQIGAHLEEQEEQMQSDLFSKTISLEASQADVTASDFMTVEEDEDHRKKNKKEPKFKKQKKKKKDKKKKKRKGESDDEEEEVAPILPKGKGLLDELEETAVDNVATSRKRRREQEDDVQQDGQTPAVETKDKVDKRAKYDAIMEKGNQRTSNVFKAKVSSSTEFDEEPDDAFLNAALAKARRLNQLKALSSLKQPARGADMVVAAVKSAQTATVPSGEGITFSVDETREFTRALRARTEQTQRAATKKSAKKDAVKQEDTAGPGVKTEEQEDEPMEDLQELAKEVKVDPDHATIAALDGTTGTTIPIGRGVGNVLNFLKQTGEMTVRNAGREEMRGRAKDKKTYEDYEPLNLAEVVRIDPNNATERDRELANREIKLEYRDKHGRLLTRKEAFRDLSYQFHGYGCGKRKEEKKAQQIAREQAEARLASRGAGVGTFGALKATQKATGKAFVVHKTQS
jgi:U4/U6.U5 tri-snRNP-associated protein 1